MRFVEELFIIDLKHMVVSVLILVVEVHHLDTMTVVDGISNFKLDQSKEVTNGNIQVLYIHILTVGIDGISNKIKQLLLINMGGMKDVAAFSTVQKEEEEL